MGGDFNIDNLDTMNYKSQINSKPDSIIKSNEIPKFK